MSAPEMTKVVQQLHSVLRRPYGKDVTDAELLKTYVEHRDEAAFEALLTGHGPMVLGVCGRVLRDPHDREDAFQATFLVLVRKAATLRRPATISNWLHGVAYRTSLAARNAARKRRTKEAKIVRRVETAEDAWADLRPVLDQELDRPPDNYRTAIVLCDLEGKTRREAAQDLGCAEGTVAGRLTRGRALLAKRLARRGVALSSVLLAAALTKDGASAGVPTSLEASTAQAAGLLVVGRTMVAGVISPGVAALVEGVVRAMFVTKLRHSAVLLMVIGLFTLASGAVVHYCLADGSGDRVGASGGSTASSSSPVDGEKTPERGKSDPQGKSMGKEQRKAELSARRRDLLDLLPLVEGKDKGKLAEEERQILEELARCKVATVEKAEDSAIKYKLKAGGVSATEVPQVVSLVPLGIDVEDFAKRGNLIWIVPFRQFGFTQITQEVWISSTTGAVLAILPLKR